MKDLNQIQNTINVMRLSVKENTFWGEHSSNLAGMFIVRSEYDETALRIIATNGGGWDHVSVSCQNRCPTWEEMEQVKKLFFKDDEVAYQLHVTADDHINIHPFTLHLWRSHEKDIPMPPACMV